jgi:hypothetical protein
MAVIGMTERGKKSNEDELGELAGQVIARYTKSGEFVMPLSTAIATARG